jgi:predicted site-specific integrase-resolvase
MKNIYSPKEFGALIGRAVITLQKWDRDGQLTAHRTPTNRRYYTHNQYIQYIGQKTASKKIISYCRVSSSGQKTDLIAQKNAVEQFCIASGRDVFAHFDDIGSGLNYKRKNFLMIMEMAERGELTEIVIAHKDRLVRFGFEWFEKFCADHGCTIVIMNSQSLSPEKEMTQDLLSIVHCFSSRLYGLRKYKKNISEFIKEKDLN